MKLKKKHQHSSEMCELTGCEKNFCHELLMQLLLGLENIWSSHVLWAHGIQGWVISDRGWTARGRHPRGKPEQDWPPMEVQPNYRDEIMRKNTGIFINVEPQEKDKNISKMLQNFLRFFTFWYAFELHDVCGNLSLGRSRKKHFDW